MRLNSSRITGLIIDDLNKNHSNYLLYAPKLLLINAKVVDILINLSNFSKHEGNRLIQCKTAG